jgi:hypothetical protein
VLVGEDEVLAARPEVRLQDVARRGVGGHADESSK